MKMRTSTVCRYKSWQGMESGRSWLVLCSLDHLKIDVLFAFSFSQIHPPPLLLEFTNILVEMN